MAAASRSGVIRGEARALASFFTADGEGGLAGCESPDCARSKPAATIANMSVMKPTKRIENSFRRVASLLNGRFGWIGLIRDSIHGRHHPRRRFVKPFLVVSCMVNGSKLCLSFVFVVDCSTNRPQPRRLDAVNLAGRLLPRHCQTVLRT